MLFDVELKSPLRKKFTKKNNFAPFLQIEKKFLPNNKPELNSSSSKPKLPIVTGNLTKKRIFYKPKLLINLKKN